MSNKYGTSEEVPLEVLCARLNELAEAVTRGKQGIDSEFTMRIPVEPDRDADCVLAEAAKRLALLVRKNLAPGREHLTWDGNFQSDKYEWCPHGYVPLSIRDPLARDLLAQYAMRRQHIDGEFTRDLLEALATIPVKPSHETERT